MGSVGGEEVVQWDTQGSSTHHEKIVVSVRLRPLNAKESARNDASDWETVNNNTIIFKSTLPERSLFPTAYTFDRVFGSECSTKQVYEEGAREVALSVVSGINSSIFAYGQTSSGKTYTMTGITEYTIADIYDHIEKHRNREFVLKFSAMEIYNEAVRDLLSSDSSPLRLLDDPERGTVVEKLIEETLRDQSHLKDLLSICEDQRKIGETSLNETSSRSHQILRLTIESSAREFLGSENSSTLTASVNFVDLAGSERACQAMSAGARLKEGCHINRSLLTLGTVIRKLSKGRSGHIPYRDSKLTRILQNSLGGNGRTAIICTMSPALSHVEQSRNTLLFASCAKEVSTNAQVNVVMSEKVLVKHLQRELARLQLELRTAGSASDSATLLREKELMIEQMDKEIKELTHQRDLAQSYMKDLLQSVGEDHASRLRAKADRLSQSLVNAAWVDEYSASESSDVYNPRSSDTELSSFNTPQYYENSKGMNSNTSNYVDLSEDSEDHFLYDDDISSRLSICSPKFVGPDPFYSWEEVSQRNKDNSEDICKEVRCIEMEESSRNINKEEPKADAFLADPGVEGETLTLTLVEKEDTTSTTGKGDAELIGIHTDQTYRALEQKVKEMQQTIDYLANFYHVEQSPCSTEADKFSSKSLKLNKSNSCTAILMNFQPSPQFNEKEEIENPPPNRSVKEFTRRPEEAFQQNNPKLNRDKDVNLSIKDEHVESIGISDSRISVESDPNHEQAENIKVPDEGCISSSLNFLGGVKIPDEGRVISSLNFVGEPSEMGKILTEKQCGDDLVHETEQMVNISSMKHARGVSLDSRNGALQLASTWPLEFERQRREILELWDACHVPLLHRTYFFLLFKGDPSDAVYMEVELRRLCFLKSKIVRDGHMASSKKALNREREMLSKQVYKRLSAKKREELYRKWGIGLATKQRRVQVARRIWTDTTNMDHIKDSAALVAQLAGFMEPGQFPKEMFGLSFSPNPINLRSHSWKSNMSSIL